LLENKIDMAIHSMKDVPYKLPYGLKIDILSKREDPRDIFINLDRKSINQINDFSVIGTGSLRRKIQLNKINNNFIVKGLRGNILTRIKKLENKEFDGIVLAAAGVKRLNLEVPYTYFSVDEMIPSQGQGIIGIETRVDFNTEFLLNSVHSKESEIVNKIERDFMREINGTCSMPVGIYAVIENNKIIIRCMVADENLLNMKVLKEEINIDEYLDYGKSLVFKIYKN
jgi:hydroxymethylbilane synthase